MPRITHVKKARKSQGSCRSCGVAIDKGDPYKWIAFRYGPRVVKCASCNFRDSELTQGKMSGVFAAREMVEDFLADWDGDLEELRSVCEDAAGEIEMVADEYQEGADNQREYFPDSEQADESEERAEALREYAQEIENVDVEDYDGERDEDDEPKDAESFEEWKGAQISVVEDALSNAPDF